MEEKSKEKSYLERFEDNLREAGLINPVYKRGEIISSQSYVQTGNKAVKFLKEAYKYLTFQYSTGKSKRKW
jgi:hypothetical protein